MSNKDHEAKDRFRPGDIFEGYYFPGVLCGRTLCYYRDIVRLLQAYMLKVQRMEKEINFKNPGTFKLFSQTYKELKFSVVQFCTEIEEKEECFQILLGVVIRLFNRKLELNSQDCTGTQYHNGNLPMESFQKTIIGKSQAIPQNSQPPNTQYNEDILDLNVSMMIMDSLQDTCQDKIDYNLTTTELEELHHNVIIIYLLFLIFKSQYKIGLEDGYEQSQTFEYMRIPITIETLEIIKNVVEKCDIKGNLFPEIKLIVRNMIENGILLVNLYNGPQYYYQDRYGNPLMPDPLEKRFLDFQDIVDSEETKYHQSKQEDEQVFMQYLQDLRTQLVENIKIKSLQLQNEDQKEKAQKILETFQQLLNDFDERISQYEFFKLTHSKKLSSINLKTPKNTILEENHSNKRRRILHTTSSNQYGFNEYSKDNETSPFNGNNNNEYGEWKELFVDKDSIPEENTTEEPKIGQEENVQLEKKDYSNNALSQNNYSETSQDSQIFDNSLLSILNRIEELVHREI